MGKEEPVMEVVSARMPGAIISNIQKMRALPNSCSNSSYVRKNDRTVQYEIYFRSKKNNYHLVIVNTKKRPNMSKSIFEVKKITNNKYRILGNK